jgi:hypothetical protein
MLILSLDEHLGFEENHRAAVDTNVTDSRYATYRVGDKPVSHIS